MAASTASMCRRSESLWVHSHSRVHASSRERGRDMAVNLAPRSRGSARGPVSPLMEKFVIEGGVPLSGTVVPAGNKNGALPILAAALLNEEVVVVRNVPRIRDVEGMLALIRRLGEPHLAASRARGADIRAARDILLPAPAGLRPCDFFMDEPSVMGTEN